MRPIKPITAKKAKVTSYKRKELAMVQSTENVYTAILTDGFRLVVECISSEDDVCFKWKIEVLETDGTVFGVTSDGEAYESKSSAEVSGRLYFLMNYAHH